MPAPLSSKEEVLARLLQTFRVKGYDGASLAELSAATGLGKSSLYHYFPGGKSDMAVQVLGHLETVLEAALFAPLRGVGTPKKRLEAMLDSIDAFYEGGERACLLERLSASVESRQFRRPLAAAFTKWIDAVEALGREAGLSRGLARTRAEDMVMRIEGALVVCAGTGETKFFARTLADLRTSVLAR
jgi:TetR/AcrR family transcriptional repressor of lmrAB and yxaGH operons